MKKYKNKSIIFSLASTEFNLSSRSLICFPKYGSKEMITAVRMFTGTGFIGRSKYSNYFPPNLKNFGYVKFYTPKYEFTTHILKRGRKPSLKITFTN